VSNKKSNKIYLVVKGRQPGLYTEWFGPRGAAEQVADLSGAVYKGFYTRETAAHWLRQFDRATLACLPPSLRDLLKSARRIDMQNFQLTISQDNYWTDDQNWRFADRYTLYKNGWAVKSLFGRFVAHSPNISLQNIAGQAAWVFADEDTNPIIYAGQDLRQKYGIDKAYRPYSLNDKLIFIAQKGDKYFVVYNGRRATPEFDHVIVAYCCEGVLYSVQGGLGKYLFSANRNGQSYLVEITASVLHYP